MPAYTFGESREHCLSAAAQLRARTRLVGPGTHENDVSSLGRQPLSHCATAPRAAVARASTAKLCKLYIPGFEHENLAKGTPGPGAHSPKSSMAVGAPLLRCAPAFSFGAPPALGDAAMVLPRGAPEGSGARPRKPRHVGPGGPGQYRAPSSLGVQPHTRCVNAPAFRFGAGGRSSGVNPSLSTGQLARPTSSVGRQSVSGRPSAPTFGFGTGARFSSKARLVLF